MCVCVRVSVCVYASVRVCVCVLAAPVDGVGLDGWIWRWMGGDGWVEMDGWRWMGGDGWVDGLVDGLMV